MTGLESLVFSLEIGQLHISHAETVAAHLVGVAGADARLGGADLALTGGRLIGGIQQTVGGQDYVGLASDNEPLGHRDTRSLQFSALLYESYRVEHHAVAYDIDRSLAEDTRRDRAQHIALVVEMERMAGVGTSLETSYCVIFLGQHINYLSLALISPLES